MDVDACKVFRLGVQDVELGDEGEHGVEGADHPLRGGVQVGAVGDAAQDVV